MRAVSAAGEAEMGRRESKKRWGNKLSAKEREEKR